MCPKTCLLPYITHHCVFTSHYRVWQCILTTQKLLIYMYITYSVWYLAFCLFFQSVGKQADHRALLTCWRHSRWRHTSLAYQEGLGCLVLHQGRLWCGCHHTLNHSHQIQLWDGNGHHFIETQPTCKSWLSAQLMPIKTKHFNEDWQMHHSTQSHVEDTESD